MRLVPAIALITGGLLLSACQPEAAGSATRGVSDVADPVAEASCVAEGGRYGTGGLQGQYMCFRPLPDAGRACSTAGDCEGYCLAETRQCSAEAPQFGCIRHLDDTGQQLVICID